MGTVSKQHYFPSPSGRGRVKLTDILKNNGASWETISKEPFHIAKKHPTKRGAYLAGSGGRISFVEL